MSTKAKKGSVRNSIGEGELEQTAKDTSPYVFQRPKLKTPVPIKEAIPWTAKQKEIIDLALDKKVKMLIMDGPAGVGKSVLAVYCALKLLNDKKVSDIIFTRTAVESSDMGLGYMKGSFEEKFGFYTTIFQEKLEELLEEKHIKALEDDYRLHEKHVGFMRGATYSNQAIIIEEAQNNTEKELRTILTRVGKFSKVFLMGDPSQADICPKKQGAFSMVARIFDNERSRENGIYIVRFTKEDVVRSEFVKFVLEMFEQEEIRKNGGDWTPKGQ